MPIPEDVHLSYLAILSSKTFQADNVHECSVKIHTDIQHTTVYPLFILQIPFLAMPSPAIVDGLCLRHRHGALLCLSGS